MKRAHTDDHVDKTDRMSRRERVQWDEGKGLPSPRYCTSNLRLCGTVASLGRVTQPPGFSAAANLEENDRIKDELRPRKCDEPKTPYHGPLDTDEELSLGELKLVVSLWVAQKRMRPTSTDLRHIVQRRPECHPWLLMKRYTPLNVPVLSDSVACNRLEDLAY